MASSSTSSSSHVTHKKYYDVFISFRGPDVRRGLLSHLKTELRSRQIDAYVDERLDRGDEISSSLLRAIEGSQISLVIFSKDYASSKWCLEELAKIIECMETNKKTLLPVFFNVDPSDVRYQRGDYADALAKHEEKHKGNMLMVQSWRSALKKAADLSGYHYPTKFRDESDLVDKIVEDILEKLSKFCQSESNNLVGIDENIAQIQSLLLMESSDKVLFVGIWGMGGIGKTTIARAIFDKYSPQYQGCCFLSVREEIQKHGLSLLREKLIFELFEAEGLHRRGTSKTRFLNSAIRRMGWKRVLVVLDDVNTSEQINDLVGESICFGEGSRVIITSRDKHVLTSGGVHQIHKVKELDPLDSLKLFCINAFNESHPKTGYEKLSEEVVKIAQGIPLALKVLGSDLHSKSLETWECALRKIKKYPNEKIQGVLRFSYHGLHEVEKKAFLDIALLFEDDDKDYVIRQLNAWGFHGASGIEVLQQKALMTISDNRIQMHDLVREMGREIVRQESIEYPGRRSRLTDNNEVFDTLRYDLGTDKVEAMQIDVSRIRDLSLKVDTFKKMPKLRFLKFYLPLHDELTETPNYLNAQSWKKLDALFVRCKELMRVASEIHIKCHHYLLIDGCSNPSLLNKISAALNEINMQVITQHRVERTLNPPTGYLSNLECTDVVDQQFINLPNDVLCLRSTYYLKISATGTGQRNTRKSKLHILFDGSRYFQRTSVSELCNSGLVVDAPEFLLYTHFRILSHLSSFTDSLFEPFLSFSPVLVFLLSYYVFYQPPYQSQSNYDSPFASFTAIFFQIAAVLQFLPFYLSLLSMLTTMLE